MVAAEVIILRTASSVINLRSGRCGVQNILFLSCDTVDKRSWDKSTAGRRDHQILATFYNFLLRVLCGVQEVGPKMQTSEQKIIQKN